uniref:Ribosomal L1 domain-containing protein 1 n=2 Tax=Chrysemys picta bellii TaxID=8478 RepID=A0A8C3FB43_CHRPI
MVGRQGYDRCPRWTPIPLVFTAGFPSLRPQSPYAHNPSLPGSLLSLCLELQPHLEPPAPHFLCQQLHPCRPSLYSQLPPHLDSPLSLCPQLLPRTFTPPENSGLALTLIYLAVSLLFQVKKAVQALLAYTKTKDKTDELLLNENENVYLMVTVWKIPPQEQVIKIPLPHGIRPETSEVCLFTKDEPELSGEQTENLYKKLLIQNGITSISQIISYKTLKKEYKPFEAKRRLLNRFDLFLADDRIRRLLPSHIGKHFYQSKKAPLSVNLKAKNLAKELNKHIQGTILPVTNKGCCYTARVGHTGMKADELLENVSVAAEVISNKLPKNWKNIKVLHLKTLKSVALPIFNSYICNLDELDKQPSLHQKGGQVKTSY